MWLERHRPPAPEADNGFTLIELLVALVLTVLIVSAVVELLDSDSTAARLQPEMADMQQRARVAKDVLFRDLLTAGSGPDVGPLAGPLAGSFPPILPRRLGRLNADAYDVALRDAVTVLSVPAGRFQTLTRSPVVSSVSAPAVPLTVACPDDDPLCGVAGGETVVVFDDEGHFDLFAVPSSRSTGIDVLRSDPPPHAYGPGAAVATVDLHTYYFDPNRRQLRHYDGRLTDVAVVDDVVALAFEYFGDPAPPAAPKPPAGVANCLYDATGAPIGGLPILPTDGDSLASLPLAMFRDGPWCGSGSQRFDVDLLRIRQVRVHLRVQAAPTLLRAAGPAYAAAGTSRDARLTAPDYALQFDVSPRNLNFDR